MTITQVNPQPSGGTAGTGRRQQVLALLRNAETARTIIDIAQELAIHPNTVRFHTERLITDGLVEEVEATERIPGRPPKFLRAVRTMDPNGQRDYRLLAQILVHTVGQDPALAARAVEAGRTWGQQIAAASGKEKQQHAGGQTNPNDATAQLVGLLGELGFSPEMPAATVPGASDTISLRNCPFLEVAQERPEIVCQIHYGMMQGAMHGWKSAVTVDTLEPFAAPDICLIHLRSQGA